MGGGSAPRWRRARGGDTAGGCDETPLWLRAAPAAVRTWRPCLTRRNTSVADQPAREPHNTCIEGEEKKKRKREERGGERGEERREERRGEERRGEERKEERRGEERRGEERRGEERRGERGGEERRGTSTHPRYPRGTLDDTSQMATQLNETCMPGQSLTTRGVRSACHARNVFEHPPHAHLHRSHFSLFCEDQPCSATTA